MSDSKPSLEGLELGNIKGNINRAEPSHKEISSNGSSVRSFLNVGNISGQPGSSAAAEKSAIRALQRRSVQKEGYITKIGTGVNLILFKSVYPTWNNFIFMKELVVNSLQPWIGFFPWSNPSIHSSFDYTLSTGIWFIQLQILNTWFLILGLVFNKAPPGGA